MNAVNAAVSPANTNPPKACLIASPAPFPSAFSVLNFLEASAIPPVMKLIALPIIGIPDAAAPNFSNASINFGVALFTFSISSDNP